MTFTLHPQLAADNFFIGDLPHCRVLLMNDRRFPWLILVPRYADKRELFDLGQDDYARVMEEVREVAEEFSALTGAHKINIAALGNQVPQLHIHIIARFQNDTTWPKPVWSAATPAMPYDASESATLREKIASALKITKM